MSFVSRFPLHLAGIALCACALPAFAEAKDDALVVHQAEVKLAQAGSAGGEALYLQHCAACHQPDGSGLAGAFPPLAKSSYIADDTNVLLTATVEGLSGPIVVNGQACPSQYTERALMDLLNFTFGEENEIGIVETGSVKSWHLLTTPLLILGLKYPAALHQTR